MIYVLDTSAFSALMRQNQQLRTRMAALQSDDSSAICTITGGEILYGLERMDEGRRRQTLLTQANKYFELLICIPITEAVGDQYAKIKRDTERKGMSLDENDLWIAATVLNVNATLVTQDSDFNRVDNLKVENWTH